MRQRLYVIRFMYTNPQNISFTHTGNYNFSLILLDKSMKLEQSQNNKDDAKI